MKSGEIWLIAKPKLRQSTHHHYVFIVDAFTNDDGVDTIALIWIATDRQHELDFPIMDPRAPVALKSPKITPSQADFEATKLTKSCHLQFDVQFIARSAIVPVAGFIPGKLQGELLQDVTDWYGTSIVEGTWPRPRPKNKKTKS